jgi:hypothetical protein
LGGARLLQMLLEKGVTLPDLQLWITTAAAAQLRLPEARPEAAVTAGESGGTGHNGGAGSEGAPRTTAPATEAMDQLEESFLTFGTTQASPPEQPPNPPTVPSTSGQSSTNEAFTDHVLSVQTASLAQLPSNT